MSMRFSVSHGFVALEGILERGMDIAMLVRHCGLLLKRARLDSNQ